jgi:hypothetical protein
MDTYYIRHTERLDIDDATRMRLWNERRIAIHFPRNRKGKLSKHRDNGSLDPADYRRHEGREAMRALKTLAKRGGYVCAEYSRHNECVLGYVSPDSQVTRIRGAWGSRHGLDGREAILKSLRLQKVKFVRPCDSASILVGRPRQGTIMRWRRAGKSVENLVKGRRAVPSLDILTPDQQEIMCSEFLRSPNASQLGVPRLAHLLLPVGRTMRDIDICGISNSGNRIFAQVTYGERGSRGYRKKMEALLKYRSPNYDAFVLFCKCRDSKSEEGVEVISLRDVYDTFAATPSGRLWMEQATNSMARSVKRFRP